MRSILQNRYLILVLLLIYIYSCTKDKYTIITTKKDSSNIKNNNNKTFKEKVRLQKGTISDATAKKGKQVELPNKKFRKILVLITHGLTTKKDLPNTVSSYDTIVKSIEKKFPKDKIDIKSLELGHSVNMHIPHQAKVIYDNAIKELDTKNKRKYTKLILIGSSAGGLASFDFYVNHKKKFNIAGIITISCPWKGTKIADCKSKIKLPIKFLIKPIIRSYDKCRLGVRDTHHCSLYLKWVRDQLNYSKIPILAIGGETKYYSKVFEIRGIKRLFVKKTYEPSQLWGTENHDGVVPLSSQLAEGLPNIISYKIKKPVHHTLGTKKMLDKIAQGITRIFKFSQHNKDTLLKVKEEKAITDSLETLEIINKFIEKYAYFPILEEEKNAKNEVLN